MDVDVVGSRASNERRFSKITRSFTITSRAFSWLKAATTAFTFKTLLRHYAKRALTPRSLHVKLGLLRDYEPSDGTFWSTTPTEILGCRAGQC